MSSSPVLQQSQSQSQSSMQDQPKVPVGTETDALLFENYTLNPKAWDELFAAPGRGHDYCQVLLDRLGGLDEHEFHQRRTSADLAFINNGITFSVYSDRRGTEKIFPFDLIPRPVSGKEWDRLEAGLIQRIRASTSFWTTSITISVFSRKGWFQQDWSSNPRGSAPR